MVCARAAGPVLKAQGNRKMVTKQIKASAGIIFWSVEFTPTVESFDTKGSCSFQSMNLKQKGSCIPYINILVSAGSL